MSTANLSNVYARLLRKYGERYTITYNAPPSYLSNIVGSVAAGAKIVLVFKEDRTKLPNSQNFVSPSKLNIKKSSSDLNLTGSPLKDDCIVDAIADLSLDMNIMEQRRSWKLDEEWHRGIPVDKAREIFCTQEFQSDSEKNLTGSVWFLCAGADAERTLLLQYEFLSNYFSRGILHFTGVVPAHGVNVQHLVKCHYELISSKTQLETYIENTYNIKPNISLRCAWSAVAPMPALIDLSSCDVTLTQTFRVGDCGPLTQDYMNQLRILLLIRDDILAYRKAEESGNNIEAVYRCGRGIDMDELRERIHQLLTEVSGFTELDSGSGAEFDIEDVVQRTKMRRLTDLTDKLWEVLKCCSTYKDLKNAFNILFQCAARRNIVNTPTNKNRLAEIITGLANHRLAIPCLSGVEPLELLLEIGLEKLYKDYEYIFTESKICSANLLKHSTNAAQTDKENDYIQPNVRKSLHNAVRSETPAKIRKTLLLQNTKHGAAAAGGQVANDSLVEFRNSNFDECESATKIAQLLQIHTTLEHLMMIHINLNLVNVYRDVCTQLLKRPLRFVDCIEDSFSDVMDIQLSVRYVREHLEGKDPHARRIIMSSKNKFRNVNSTFYYSMENICPPDLAECLQCDDKEMVKENTYYSWLYRKIVTLKSSV